MNTTSKAATEKAKNYSDEQVEILQSFDVITYAQACEFAEMWGKSNRSVISKIHSLEIPYEKKPVPAKKQAKITKGELVERIESATGSDLWGLEKATVRSLVELCHFFGVSTEVETETE